MKRLGYVATFGCTALSGSVSRQCLAGIVCVAKAQEWSEFSSLHE